LRDRSRFSISLSLADPELQNRGAKFLPKFFNDVFLGVSRKNFNIFPKNCHLSPKISDDLFLVIDLFYCFNVVFFRRGAKSVANVDKGGPKSLLFHKYTMLPLRFLPPRGAKLHCQLRWGAMAGFVPLDPPLIRLVYLS